MMHLGSLTRRIVLASHGGGIGQIAYAGEFRKCLSTQTKAKLDAVVDLVKQQCARECRSSTRIKIYLFFLTGEINRTVKAEIQL